MISGSWEDRENEEGICERVKEKRMASKEDNWEGEKTRKRRWGEEGGEWGGGDWVRGWRKEEAKGKG